MDFSILLNKKIYAILIGDQNVFDEYSLPYLSGPDLCTLCSQFGLPRTYRWQSGNVSRWMYMQDLMEFLNKQNIYRKRLMILELFSVPIKKKITSGL